ncbi:hypothetical protein AUP68_13232 [Ilyonectria robusta]
MVDEVAEAESGADHLCGPDSCRPKPWEAAPQCVAAVPPYSTRPAAHYPVACTRYPSQRAPSWAIHDRRKGAEEMAADAIDIPLSMTAPVFLPCSCRPSHECAGGTWLAELGLVPADDSHGAGDGWELDAARGPALWAAANSELLSSHSAPGGLGRDMHPSFI